MAPSESSILRNFLLPPAPLPVALPFDQFKDLFPRSLQANPGVVALYRELQHQRAIDMDDVKRNIETEVKKGELQRREVLRARKKSHEAEMKDIDQHELVMESELFGRSTKPSLHQPHSLRTIIPDMQDACNDLETEIAELENESVMLLADIKLTIGDLSDLRFGKFNRVSGISGDLSQEVIKGLERLEHLCNAVEKG